MNYYTQEVLTRDKQQGFRRTARHHRSIQQSKYGHGDEGKSNFHGKLVAAVFAIITLATAVAFSI